MNDDVTLINELGLLGKKEQSLSKTTDITKESSNQATNPIKIVNITPGNSDNLNKLISKDISNQI